MQTIEIPQLLAYAKKVCQTFRKQGFPKEELVAVALACYTRVQQKFDNTKNTKFSSYLYQAMFYEVKQYVNKNRHTPISDKHQLGIIDEQSQLPKLKFCLPDNFTVGDLDYLTPNEFTVFKSRFSGHPIKIKVIATTLKMSLANVCVIQRNALRKVAQHIKQQRKEEEIVDEA